MKSILKQSRWSPYGVGIGIGMLSWVTFAFMGKALGASTTLVRAVAAIEGTIAPSHVYANAYFHKYIGTASEPLPIFEWQFALVVMMIFGALLSSRLSGDRIHEDVPKLWKWRFGSSKGLRYMGAFCGGVILLFGARLAGGCTSGHGISGGLQLAVSSWTFFLCMFGAGVVTAFILYGKGGRDHV